MYIKHGMHPSFRKETGRMRQSLKPENEKPENQGRDVQYDQTTRVITVDGIVVDHFNPSLFHWGQDMK